MFLRTGDLVGEYRVQDFPFLFLLFYAHLGGLAGADTVAVAVKWTVVSMHPLEVNKHGQMVDRASLAEILPDTRGSLFFPRRVISISPRFSMLGKDNEY